MKKTIFTALMLSVTLLLLFSSCGGDDDRKETETSAPVSTETADPYNGFHIFVETLIEGEWTYDAYADCNAVITAFSGKGEVTVPDILGKCTVYAIADGVFQNNTAITSVTIPLGVTKLGTNLFSGCTSLMTVTLPNEEAGVNLASNKLNLNEQIPEYIYTIPDGSFDGCTSLTSVNIPINVMKIGAASFRNCTSLITLEVSEYVEEIGEDAFDGCAWVTQGTREFHIAGRGILIAYNGTGGEVFIPDYVYSISSKLYGADRITVLHLPVNLSELSTNAFLDCTSLEKVYTKAHTRTTIIGESAFRGCTSLTLVDLSFSVVEDIYESAFRGCFALETVNLPSTISSIEDNAFLSCLAIKTTNYVGNEASWANIEFGTDNDCLTDATVIFGYVPK